MSLSFFSPAKINLFLRILGKRNDGYHALATLMQAISLGDLLHIAPSESDHMTCSDPRLPCDASNLVLKAAALFRLKSGLPLYINVHLEKQIPIEAGLGGGSSNAATVLYAMNQFAGSKFSVQMLQEWSGQIGSDIPFFFSQGTAYCTGRGEHVESLDPLSLPTIWIVKPPQGLSTRAVYGEFKADKAPKKDPQASLKGFQDAKLKGAFPLYNDLEEPALRLDSSLSLLHRILKEQYGCNLLLSGSGSSFFCLGETPPELSHSRFSGCIIEKAVPAYRKIDNWYTRP